ncbi:MAG: hypothetical protein IRY94_05510 [Rhodospirillaceae bacterium]|nr:hypothetical protein [Rhodospirillaceae bacterium]
MGAARLIGLALVLGAALALGLGTARGAPAAPGGAKPPAESETPPPANQWVIQCGTFGGQRFCQVFYIYIDPAAPDDFVTFGVVRILGVEAPFLDVKRGFVKNSRVFVRVDELPARDYPAPAERGRVLSPRVPSDPLANEMARGQRVAIFFKPANGMQRNITIPLGVFGLLLDEARAEVPPAK